MVLDRGIKLSLLVEHKDLISHVRNRCWVLFLHLPWARRCKEIMQSLTIKFFFKKKQGAWITPLSPNNKGLKQAAQNNWILHFALLVEMSWCIPFTLILLPWGKGKPGGGKSWTVFLSQESGKAAYIEALPAELAPFEKLLAQNDGGKGFIVGKQVIKPSQLPVEDRHLGWPLIVFRRWRQLLWGEIHTLLLMCVRC